MSATAAERETVVTVSDADDVVSIWTAQRPVVRRLTKDDRFTLIASGEHDGSPWATFTIPADRWSPVTGAKRRFTDAQRAALERSREASGTVAAQGVFGSKAATGTESANLPTTRMKTAAPTGVGR